jgi:V8-like Glu-specific endopeptidase
MRPLRRTVSALAVGLTVAISLMTPAAGDPAAMAAQRPGASGTPFDGTPTVGALFTDKNGKLTHFCTASVVHSPARDLLITAAHCMQGRSLRPAGAIVFAPGYHGNTFPYGRWVIRDSLTDGQWRRHRNPDDDFAFLIAGRPGRHIERSTGAQRLATGTRLPAHVQVIGYPDAADKPITCANQARAFREHHLRQMVFDCAGYTDGTSGGPFLFHVRKATGTGSVIGVIGGYQQGGNTPSVSYSARFLASMAALYKSVTS